MKENVIISLADSNYFELLNELIDSIKQFNYSEKVATQKTSCNSHNSINIA